MVCEACLPNNAYYPRTPDYTLCSGVHVCWSEHSDSSFVYGFMCLDYGFGTITATTLRTGLLVLFFLNTYIERSLILVSFIVVIVVQYMFFQFNSRPKSIHSFSVTTFPLLHVASTLIRRHFNVVCPLGR